MKAIVVEDNSGIRELVVDLLHRRGHDVVAYPDAESAWAGQQDQDFDIAILDWGLPGMDGLELCHLLRGRPNGEAGYILFLTGRAEPDDLDEIIATGANDYVTKPFKLDALEIRVGFAERQAALVAEGIRAKSWLADSEARYRDLVERLPVITYIELSRYGQDDVLTYISPQIERSLGWTPDEVTQDNLLYRSLIHPDDVAELMAVYERSRASGGPLVAEYRIRTKAGDYRWVHDECVIIPNGDSSHSWHGFMADITDRRLAEDALRESEQQHRALSISAERHANEVQLLDRVRKSISRELELPEVFRTVVDATVEHLGYDFAGLYIVCGDELVLQHQRGYPDDADVYERISLSSGVVGSVARTGEPCLIDDVRGDPEYLEITPEAVHELCVPLVDDGRVVGVFNVETRDERPLDDQDLQMLMSVAEHVTTAFARSRLYQKVRESELRLRTVLQSVQEVVFQVDTEGRWSFLNQAWEEISGFPVEYALGRHPWEFGTDTNRVELRSVVEALVSGVVEEVRREFRIVTSDGSKRWVEAHAVRSNAGAPPFELSGTLIDITERKRTEQLLIESQDRYRFLALHDPLTGLPNRALFMERLEKAVRDHSVPGAGAAVLFLDLDGFKLVNDSFGHEIGDRLLVQVAIRLRQCVREGDMVARLGGDEFAVLIGGVVGSRIPEETSHRILAALREPFDIDGIDVVVGTSIGVVCHVDSSESGTDVLRKADTALYAAKAAGRGVYALYEPHMSAAVLAKVRQEAELRHAIEAHQLVLHYQPAFDLRTGKVTGAEVLVRWQHPEHGLLPPAQFIALAESTGLIVPLGAQVLREACRQSREWQLRCGRTVPRLSVNLSARQLHEPTIVQDLATIMTSEGVDPSLVEFEITESAVMADGRVARRALSELRALGVHLAIDDFGTGYASLSSLRDLPVDGVKIDRGFVAGLGRDRASAPIVRAIAELAKALGLAVTAEGIETVEQLARIRAIGIDAGQGYYFTRPLPSDAVGSFLTGDSPINARLFSVR